MHLVQILLPIFDERHARYDDALFARTRDELIARFGGVTAYVRSPAAGAWIDPRGAIERDQVIMVEVLVEEVDAAWWRHYVELLQQRFGQEEIHARALPARKL